MADFDPNAYASDGDFNPEEYTKEKPGFWSRVGSDLAAIPGTLKRAFYAPSAFAYNPAGSVQAAGAEAARVVGTPGRSALMNAGIGGMGEGIAEAFLPAKYQDKRTPTEKVNAFMGAYPRNDAALSSIAAREPDAAAAGGLAAGILGTPPLGAFGTAAAMGAQTLAKGGDLGDAGADATANLIPSLATSASAGLARAASRSSKNGAVALMSASSAGPMLGDFRRWETGGVDPHDIGRQALERNYNAGLWASPETMAERAAADRLAYGEKVGRARAIGDRVFERTHAPEADSPTPYGIDAAALHGDLQSIASRADNSLGPEAESSAARNFADAFRNKYGVTEEPELRLRQFTPYEHELQARPIATLDTPTVKDSIGQEMEGSPVPGQGFQMEARLAPQKPQYEATVQNVKLDQPKIPEWERINSTGSAEDLQGLKRRINYEKTTEQPKDAILKEQYGAMLRRHEDALRAAHAAEGLPDPIPEYADNKRSLGLAKEFEGVAGDREWRNTANQALAPSSKYAILTSLTRGEPARALTVGLANNAITRGGARWFARTGYRTGKLASPLAGLADVTPGALRGLQLSDLSDEDRQKLLQLLNAK